MAKDLEFFKTLLNGLTNKIDSDRTWDKLKDKPFYEETKTVNEPLSITWDGNTEGLVRVGEDFFKVSDVVLTDEQIKTSTLFANTGFGLPVINEWDSMVEAGMVTEDIVAVGEGFAIFVRRPGSVIGPFVFPEVGIYFVVINAEIYISGLTTTEPVEHTEVVTKKIDPKFLPDNIGGGGVKYVNVVTDWDDETDEAVYSADASYADIIGWIEADMEVKCVFGTDIYNLIHVYPVPGIIQHVGMANSVMFYRADHWNSTSIEIREDGYVYVHNEEKAIASQLSVVAWSGNYNDLNDRIVGDNVEEYRTTVLPLQLSTRNQLPEGVVFEDRNYIVDVSYKWYSNNQQVVREGMTFSPIQSTVQGVKGYTCSDNLSLFIYDDNTAEVNPGSMQIKDVVFTIYELKTIVLVKQLDPKYLPTDHINSLINESLGVIENGTY